MLQQENRWLWLLAITGIAAAILLCRQIGNRRRRRAEMRLRAAADFDRAYRMSNASQFDVSRRLFFHDGQIEVGFLRELATGNGDGTAAVMVRFFPSDADPAFPAEFSCETRSGGL